MFVIYTPIYAAQSGLGDLVGATIVSVGTAWTLTVPFWGWIGRKYGVRRLLKTGFVTTSALSLLVYFNASTPVIASTLLVFCALGATMLDGMGNVLFYRAVRGRERSEMTAVFATYRDTGQLATPGLYAVLLGFFTLPVVFLSASIWMLVASWYCRYIPARMR
jgi:MFS family permease